MKKIYVSPSIAEALGVNASTDKPDLVEVARLFNVPLNDMEESVLVVTPPKVPTINLADFKGYLSQPKPPQYIRSEPKQKRNDLCRCGSGKKFKNCCK